MSLTNTRRVHSLLLLSAFIAVCWCVVIAAGKSTSASPSSGKHYGSRPAGLAAPRLPRRALDEIYSSGQIHLPIPDRGTVSHTIDVSGAEVIEDCNILIQIQHTWIRDLRITVTHIGAETDSVTLLDLFPGDSVVDMHVWFDSDADSSIVYGASWIQVDSADSHLTLVGSWRPQQGSLDSLTGMSGDGQWILNVTDRFALDTGVVEEWAVEINRTRPLHGVVTNANTGDPVASVKVETDPPTAAIYSTAAGVYGFDILANGTYDVIFSKELFDSVIFYDVVIDNITPIVLDAEMYPNAVTHEFASVDTVINLPDNDPVGDSLRINVRGGYEVADLDVTVNITHTYAADLKLKLRNPSGIQVVLVPPACPGAGGANYTNCRFDDEAEQSIRTGTAPFTGSWRPEQSLVAFDQTVVNGNWYLVASDSCGEDVGSINNYTLHILEALTADERVGPPASFALLSVYPNPFNSSSHIELSLAAPVHATLKIFDVNGREIALLANGNFSAGIHHFYFAADHLASGIYFARLETPNVRLTRKLILLK